MEHSITTKIWDLVILLVSVSLVCCHQGKAQTGSGTGVGTSAGTVTGTGSGTVTGSVTGTVTGADPAQIVAKALLCFDEKSIYISCEESYRLTQTGDINVPPDHVDEYCSGPCLTETHLLLDCIEDIMINFEFYNKATIQDVRDTIDGGCGHGSKRGNFNVAEHIQAEASSASKITNQILLGLGFMIAGNALLL